MDCGGLRTEPGQAQTQIIGLQQRSGWDSNPHALASAGFQDRFLSQFGHRSNAPKMPRFPLGLNYADTARSPCAQLGLDRGSILLDIPSILEIGARLCSFVGKILLVCREGVGTDRAFVVKDRLPQVPRMNRHREQARRRDGGRHRGRHCGSARGLCAWAGILDYRASSCSNTPVSLFFRTSSHGKTCPFMAM